METKEFKKIFGAVAVGNGFKKVPGGWYKESDECLVILNLQKSSYSNLYYLNIKTYVHGTFEERYTPSKYWVVNYPGNIFRRQPTEYDLLFDLENHLLEAERERGLKELFSRFIVGYTQKMLSTSEIRGLAKGGQITLLPNVEKKLFEMK